MKYFLSFSTVIMISVFSFSFIHCENSKTSRAPCEQPQVPKIVKEIEEKPDNETEAAVEQQCNCPASTFSSVAVRPHAPDQYERKIVQFQSFTVSDGTILFLLNEDRILKVPAEAVEWPQ